MSDSTFTRDDWRELPRHPLSELFPLIAGEDREKLVQSIREHGLREAIWLFEDQILDGWNRYFVCRETETEPRFRRYEGDDPLGFVIDLNLRRRHLDESQRGMIAAKIANLKPGDNQYTEAPSIEGTSQSQAAKLLNVGVATVERAAKVLHEGAPEVVDAVDSGAMKVSAAAELVKLSPEEQPEKLAALQASARPNGKITAADVRRAVDGDPAPPAAEEAPAAITEATLLRELGWDRITFPQFGQVPDWTIGDLLPYTPKALAERLNMGPMVFSRLVHNLAGLGFHLAEPPVEETSPGPYPVRVAELPDEDAEPEVWEAWAKASATSLEEAWGARAACWLVWAIVNEERSNPETRKRLRNLALYAGIKPQGRQRKEEA